MLKFKKFPRMAYRDQRFQRWAARFDSRLHTCDFMEFEQGDSLAVAVPVQFHALYQSAFEEMRPGPQMTGNGFLTHALESVILGKHEPKILTPYVVQLTLARLYEQWLASEADELEKRTQAIGLHIRAPGMKRLKKNLREGVAA